MDRIGLLVRVYMKNGTVFTGAVRLWSKKDGVLLASPTGEIIEIYSFDDICAVVYIEKNGEPMKENNSEDLVPHHKPGDIKSAAELHKLRIEAEREIAKNKLKSPTLSSEPVQYGSQIAILKNAMRK